MIIFLGGWLKCLLGAYASYSLWEGQAVKLTFFAPRVITSHYHSVMKQNLTTLAPIWIK